MLRTGLKLLVAALVLHATYRVGMAYWEHYEFQDAVHRLALFAGDDASDDELRQGILELAEEQAIPLDPEVLDVNRERRRIRVGASYTRDVEVVPDRTYPWQFDLDVAVVTLN